ncbi:MAG: hypothetical protein KDA24_22195 [Deltaproteobacteria bacterium]|nr:hypothetical protein [Deltaproteobacteria bacterium]
MDRRTFLLALASTACAPHLARSVPASSERVPTPRQVEGPYYPPPAMRTRRFPGDLDADLTRVGEVEAEGVRLALLGRVRGLDGHPAPGVGVEIWQTCHRGRYLHPMDDWGSEIPKDPGFAYYGATKADAQGRFAFLTVMPRRYPSGAQREWWRPPHVHVKVTDGKKELLTTQLYFDDPTDPDNSWKHRAVQEVDRVLGSAPLAGRHRLILRLKPIEPGSDAAKMAARDTRWGVARAGTADIVLGDSSG